MKKIYLLPLFLILIAVSAKGQVKIGDTTPPHNFSALEIENIGKGVRLPQLTTIQQNAVTLTIEASADPKLAGGLLIYNVTNQAIEMWKDEVEKWISLPQGAGVCVATKIISVVTKSSSTLDEYGTEDLLLEALASGNSGNADLYYEWFLEGVQVGDGKQYRVPKNRLSFREAGDYTVKVISCAGTPSAETKMSPAVTITINEL